MPVLSLIEGMKSNPLVGEPVVHRLHPVDFVEDGLGQAWPELLASKKLPFNSAVNPQPPIQPAVFAYDGLSLSVSFA